MWSVRRRHRLIAEPVAAALLATGSGAADATRRPRVGVPPPHATTCPSMRSWELVVNNYFAMETEATFRRREWARAVAAAARSSLNRRRCHMHGQEPKTRTAGIVKPGIGRRGLLRAVTRRKEQDLDC